jgi:hypothetical protein
MRIERSGHAFHNACILERFQIFYDEVERHWSILR